jgi:hypothetical protein
MRNFINTKEFSPAAKHYRRYGRYDDGEYNTRTWIQYWDEEFKRCAEGFSVGGEKITGRHYFALNYAAVDIVDKTVTDFNVTGERKLGFMNFWDEHYNFFWVKEIAKNGISKEDYVNLNLDISINPEHLNGNKHVLWLKPRGVGASIVGGADTAYNYFLKKKSSTFNVANDSAYLIKDGIISKFIVMRDFINTYRYNNELVLSPHGFAKNTLTTNNSKMIYESGILTNGGSVAGFQSKVMGFTLNNDPNKARGIRGIQINFEEFGKAPNIDKAWNIARPSVEAGDVNFGMLVGWGTGGTEGNDFIAMERMFYDPDTYNIIAVNNQWDDGANNNFCCYFTPAYKSISFIDSEGNSLKDKAKNFYEEQFKILARGGDSGSLLQRKAEFPFCPANAMLNTYDNPFNSAELIEHLAVMESPSAATGIPIKLISDGNKTKYKVDYNLKPITSFPLKKEDKIEGCVMMYEPPYRDKEGNTPSDMYIICVDPYAHDEVVNQNQNTSLGAAYVFENSNSLTSTKGDIIVASYVGRPKTQDDFNANLFKLAVMYNAKIGLENDRGDIIGYAKRFKLMHLLEGQFTLGFDSQLSKSKVNRAFGMHMTTERKAQGVLYTKDWINSPRATLENGKQILNLHTIKDVGLLKELTKFNDKGNFDRISALLIGMYYKKEVMYQNRQITTLESSKSRFFNKILFKR